MFLCASKFAHLSLHKGKNDKSKMDVFFLSEKKHEADILLGR